MQHGHLASSIRDCPAWIGVQHQWRVHLQRGRLWAAPPSCRCGSSCSLPAQSRFARTGMLAPARMAVTQTWQNSVAILAAPSDCHTTTGTPHDVSKCDSGLQGKASFARRQAGLVPKAGGESPQQHVWHHQRWLDTTISNGASLLSLLKHQLIMHARANVVHAYACTPCIMGPPAGKVSVQGSSPMRRPCATS